MPRGTEGCRRSCIPSAVMTVVLGFLAVSGHTSGWHGETLEISQPWEESEAGVRKTVGSAGTRSPFWKRKYHIRQAYQRQQAGTGSVPKDMLNAISEKPLKPGRVWNFEICSLWQVVFGKLVLENCNRGALIFIILFVFCFCFVSCFYTRPEFMTLT